MTRFTTCKSPDIPPVIVEAVDANGEVFIKFTRSGREQVVLGIGMDGEIQRFRLSNEVAQDMGLHLDSGGRIQFRDV